MSDPVTNVEIEDVLSSIRRLVSDGDKARTRDPAPAEAAVEPAPEAQPEPVARTESKPDKLVLTPAFMVPDSAEAGSAPEEEARASSFEGASDDHADDDFGDDLEDDPDSGWVEDTDWDTPEVPDTAAQDEAAQPDVQDVVEDQKTEGHRDDIEAPLPLRNMPWDSVDAAPEVGAASPVAPDVKADPEPKGEVPDRSSLVATIAELEAAVSTGEDDFEPDGSEVMGDTIAWPGAVARSFENVEDADDLTDVPAGDDTGSHDAAQEATAPAAAAPDPIDTTEVPVFAHAASVSGEPANQDVTDDAADDYGDEDLDGLLEAGGAMLDEEALRALVADVVREELTGPLGEKITRNVRKLVRREIYRILSSQEFD